MREIKFRVWLKENQLMSDVFTLSRTTQGWGMAAVDYRPKDHYELMQYTGLKDKNGREIYEGDIVRLNNKNYDPEYDLFYEGIVVVEQTESLGFNLKAIDPVIDGEFNKYDSSRFWHFAREDTTEIIGNIYENPELVGEK